MHSRPCRQHRRLAVSHRLQLLPRRLQEVARGTLLPLNGAVNLEELALLAAARLASLRLACLDQQQADDVKRDLESTADRAADATHVLKHTAERAAADAIDRVRRIDRGVSTVLW